jgi:hypothetical protein
MPKPTKAHAHLASLAGEWRGEEILHPSAWAPERRTAIGTFSSKMILDGMYLTHDYVEERDGKVVFRGHGIYGWDPKRERYTMHWFDSMGFPPSETLGVLDGATLTFQNSGAHGHARYTYALLDADRFTFRIDNSRDGQSWSPVMEGEYRRVG